LRYRWLDILLTLKINYVHLKKRVFLL
jgi:hypothetical protein